MRPCSNNAVAALRAACHRAVSHVLTTLIFSGLSPGLRRAGIHSALGQSTSYLASPFSCQSAHRSAIRIILRLVLGIHKTMTATSPLTPREMQVYFQKSASHTWSDQPSGFGMLLTSKNRLVQL